MTAAQLDPSSVCYKRGTSRKKVSLGGRYICVLADGMIHRSAIYLARNVLGGDEQKKPYRSREEAGINDCTVEGRREKVCRMDWSFKISTV